MKVKILLPIAVLVLAIGTTGCYKDILSPGNDPTAPPQAVSFSGDLLPILVSQCATSGCHDGIAKKPPLTADKAFTALHAGGYINTLVPANSVLYTEVKSGAMPPAGAMKPSDVQKILDWIRNGAPNN